MRGRSRPNRRPPATSCGRPRRASPRAPESNSGPPVRNDPAPIDARRPAGVESGKRRLVGSFEPSPPGFGPAGRNPNRRAKQSEDHEPPCPHGGRADVARRARLRHLQPAAERAHRLPGDSGRRPDRQPHRRPAAAPGVRGPGQGHLALHQLAGRLGVRGPRDLRHDAVHQARRADDLRRHRDVDGRAAAGRRRGGEAHGAPEREDPHPPGQLRLPGPGDGHRDPRQGDHRHPSAPRPHHREAHEAGVRQGPQRHRARLLHVLGGGQELRHHRSGDLGALAPRPPGKLRRGTMARPTDSNEQLLCSFCGKSQRQVKKLIAGPGVYICDECIDLCNEIIDEELTAPPSFDIENLPKPREIYDVLDEYVVGQDESKRTLSVAVYNHYKRVQMMQSDDSDIELQKSNILLLGPTGCGKTLLAQTLARILNVPFAIADPTALTEAGYVGEDVENILLKLIQAADYDVKKAETGIIYIDEVDKIARKADNPSITRDVSGEGVQQALLKILEGTQASVPPQGGRKHPHQEFLTIDTTNVLFICGGAFANLDKVIERRIGHKGVGFAAAIEIKGERDTGEVFEHCLPEDLIEYGLIPEFIGRLPVMSAVHQLTREDLVSILVEPRNALVKQFQRFFSFDGIELVFSEDSLVAVAEKGLARETGARGLRSIVEEILLEVQFELPSRRDVKKCVVTKETVEKGLTPTLVTEAARDEHEDAALREESA